MSDQRYSRESRTRKRLWTRLRHPLRAFDLDAVPAIPALNEPGRHPRGVYLGQLLWSLAAVGFLLGVVVGFVLIWVVAQGVHRGAAAVVGVVGLVPVAGLAIVHIGLHRTRWSLVNNLKGLKAERYVGQSIQDALLAGNCTVVHGVDLLPGIAGLRGGIDHVVATPRSVYVVETKWRPVPKEGVNRVVREVDAKAQLMRAWLEKHGHHVPVEGRLVLASDYDREASPYEVDGGRQIWAMNVAQLREELNSDRVAQRGPVSSKLGALVRSLGLDQI